MAGLSRRTVCLAGALGLAMAFGPASFAGVTLHVENVWLTPSEVARTYAFDVYFGVENASPMLEAWGMQMVMDTGDPLVPAPAAFLGAVSTDPPGVHPPVFPGQVPFSGIEDGRLNAADYWAVFGESVLVVDGAGMVRVEIAVPAGSVGRAELLLVTEAGLTGLSGPPDGTPIPFTPDHGELIVAEAGDLDTDGTVSFLEAATVVANVGLSGGDWSGGDLNFDGLVEMWEAEAAVASYGQAPSGGMPVLVIPEPGCVLLLGWGLCFGVMRRRC